MKPTLSRPLRISLGLIAALATISYFAKVPGAQAPEGIMIPLQNAEKFPDAVACLDRTGRSATPPNLARLDWSSMHNDQELEHCLFTIASALGSAERTKDWLAALGFEAEVHTLSSENIAVDALWQPTATQPTLPYWRPWIVHMLDQLILPPWGFSAQIIFDTTGQAIESSARTLHL